MGCMPFASPSSKVHAIGFDDQAAELLAQVNGGGKWLWLHGQGAHLSLPPAAAPPIFSAVCAPTMLCRGPRQDNDGQEAAREAAGPWHALPESSLRDTRISGGGPGLRLRRQGLQTTAAVVLGAAVWPQVQRARSWLAQAVQAGAGQRAGPTRAGQLPHTHPAGLLPDPRSAAGPWQHGDRHQPQLRPHTRGHHQAGVVRGASCKQDARSQLCACRMADVALAVCR
jgi:hypothetical protein